MRRAAVVLGASMQLAALATHVAMLRYGRRASRCDGEPADAIVVFGAALMPWGPRLGQPTPLLQERLDRAVEIAAAGRAPVIVVSGGAEETQAMRAALLAAGVTAAVELDERGVSTRATLANVAASGRRRIVAVTSRNHVLRVVLEARRQGLAAQVCAARPTLERDPLRWRIYAYVRELVALWAYALGGPTARRHPS